MSDATHREWCRASCWNILRSLTTLGIAFQTATSSTIG